MSSVVRDIVYRYASTKLRDKLDTKLLEAIDMERAVEYLYRDGKITDSERAVLGAASIGHSVSTGAKELGISRWLYSRKLRTVCAKMANFLGWEYSDARIVDMVEFKLKRPLSKEEANSLKELLRVYTPTRSGTDDIISIR